MCGICGIISNKKFDLPNSIMSMNHLLRHRGPDDEGFAFFDMRGGDYKIYGGRTTPENVYLSNHRFCPQMELHANEKIMANAVLGHRRLSIIDLTPTGHQPMCTQDGRYWIVYNGEIYNYLELREKLNTLGHSFYSESDTEVLLNSFSQWGTDAIKRFIGMFAFAVIDRKRKKLILARDFFGIKPLYYTFWRKGFAFASEIKALLSLPNVKRNINPQRLYDYLYGGITDHGRKTLISDIRQLPPAHYLSIDIQNPIDYTPARYWEINREVTAQLSFYEASRKLQEMFIQNVRLHLRSDVTVGAALSGGIDSSAITMSMRKLQGNGLELHTFSHIAEDPAICEEKWVDIIGKKSASTVHKVRPTADELLYDLDSLIYYQDEPFGSTSIYAQHRVMRLAKENDIKVMLDGQGADELLAGYNYYCGSRLASLIRQLKWVAAVRFYLNTIQSGFVNRKTLLMQAGSYFIPHSLQSGLKKAFGVDKITSWIIKGWFVERQANGVSHKPERSKNILRDRLYESLTQWGLNSLLRYEDRNSMAFSIESRVPFLTPELANFLFSLPEEYILDSQGTTKSVFRSAMRGIVPDDILDRRDKIGFATSEFRWLKVLKPWIDDTLNSDVAQNIPVVEIDKFKEDWNDIVSGKNPFDWRIWRVLNLIKWIELTGATFE